MKRSWILMMGILFAALPGFAERISEATARRIAERMVESHRFTQSTQAHEGVKLVYTAAAAPGISTKGQTGGKSAADYFVYNFPSQQGFVIIAGDDRVRPIWGYADERAFDPDNVPENLRDMLIFYQKELAWAEAQDCTASDEIVREWDDCLYGTMNISDRRKVTLNTALWDQSEPYNLQTPTSGGERTLTGCVATAMGIIMKYHEYPAQAVNPPATNTYKVNGTSTTTSINYTPYDWSNMLHKYEDGRYSNTEAQAVAQLLWHCGANVEMDYRTGASGTSSKRAAYALRDVFGYSPSIVYLRKEAYRWAEWKQMMTAELDLGYPIYYNGSSDIGGHAFICDGYDDQGLFHINWGWGGSSNGFFQLSVLDAESDGHGYSKGQGMILHIRPTQQGAHGITPCYTTVLNYTVGSNQITATFDLCYPGLTQQTFSIGLGIVDANGKITRYPDISFDKTFNPSLGGWITSHDKKAMLELTEPLAEGERATLLCSTNGAEWEVLRTLENLPIGCNANGEIMPGADNPDEPAQTMIASILWNKFEEKNINNTKNLGNISSSSNTNYIGYKFNHVTDEVVLRYTINNYDLWRDHVAVYYGKEWINNAGQGTAATIDNQGTFEIRVPKSDLRPNGQYFNFMKILCDRNGFIDYDIQVLSGESENPVLEMRNQKIYVTELISGTFTPKELTGKTNEWISFDLQLSPYQFGESLNNILDGQDVQVQLKLLYVPEDLDFFFNDGVSDAQHIELRRSSDNPRIFETPYITLPKVTEGKYYNFQFKAGSPTTEGHEYIQLSALKIGSNALKCNGKATFQIEQGTTPEYYRVAISLDHLKVNQEVTAVVKGETVTLTLTADENYYLPEAVEVTMGNKTLVQGTDYTYNAETGELNIPNVTGDLRIVAKGVQRTYNVTFHRVEGAWFDLNGSDEVAEGESLTFRVMVDEGYDGTDMVVKANGKTLTADETGNYTIKDIRENIEVTVSGIVKKQPVTEYCQVVTELTDLKPTLSVTEVVKGESLTLTLEADEGYDLPETIEVTMGNETLVQDKDYTYDATTGELTVPNVTADVRIVAQGVLRAYIVKFYNVEGAAIKVEGSTEVPEGGSLTFRITVEEGYDGTNMVVKANENILTADEAGVYTIKDIRENIEVTVSGIVKKQPVTKYYKVQTQLTHLKPAQDVTEIMRGETLSLTLKADEGYDLPEAVEVTMGVEQLVQDKEYTYDKTTGELTIPNVIADVRIVAEAVQRTYNVTLPKVEGAVIEAEGATEVAEGGSLTFRITVEEGYDATEMVVKANGNTLTADEAGVYTIKDIRENIEVTVSGIVKKQPVKEFCQVQTQLTHLKPAQNVTEVVKGETLTLTLKADEGYLLPETVEVTMGNETLLQGKGYTYDATTGELTVPNVTADVRIVAEAVQRTYIVTLPVVEGATIEAEGSTEVAEGGSLTFRITVENGYDATEMVVKANGKTLTTTDKEVYTITDIRENILVTVSGIKKVETDIPNSTDGALKVWSSLRQLHVQLPAAATILIYDLEGQPVHSIAAAAGTHTYDMPQGVYVITINQRSYKLRF